MTTQMVFVHALSPIRVGVGQGVGVIDLPVIREKHTGWPYLPGTSLKGVLRDACCHAEVDVADIRKVFGPEADAAGDDDKAGGVAFADLHLMFLPVRTFRGSFAWVTCPLVLARWQRDQLVHDPANVYGRGVDEQTIVLMSDSAKETIAIKNQVYLEDLSLSVKVDTALESVVQQVAHACFDDEEWKSFFLSRVGIVSDTTFTYLSITAMEVAARNRIDDTRKIVAQGALWWEEFAPAETIFSGIMLPTRQGLDAYDQSEDTLFSFVRQGAQQPVQIGANATVGRGLARVKLPAGHQEVQQP